MRRCRYRGKRSVANSGAAVADKWGNRVRATGSTGISNVGTLGNQSAEIAWRGEFTGITVAETHFSTEGPGPHQRHEFPGFFMPFRGAFEVISGTDTFRLCSGQACYYGPDETYSLHVLSQGGSGLDVEVKEGYADIFTSLRGGITQPGSRIPMILIQLHRELRVQDAASRLAVQGLVLQAAAQLNREKTSNAPEPPLWVKRAAKFLAENLSDRIDMRRLTAVSGFGARNLIRGFKTFFKLTPAEYLRSQRIATARQRLAETSEPIARVASDVGFYDQAHFCHEFKKATGCSPREYRELCALREAKGTSRRTPSEALLGFQDA